MDNCNKVREALEELHMAGADFLDVITNWLGIQLLDDDFMEFLEEEGIIY